MYITGNIVDVILCPEYNNIPVPQVHSHESKYFGNLLFDLSLKDINKKIHTFTISTDIQYDDYTTTDTSLDKIMTLYIHILPVFDSEKESIIYVKNLVQFITL